MYILMGCTNHCWPHRTLEVAKTVVKHKSFVYNKSDMMVDLSGDEKLDDVSFLCSFSLKSYQIVQPNFLLHHSFS